MSATTVQSFYIAYYGRPADPSGLDFWVGRVAAEGSFDSLVAAFGTSAEATELFADKTDTQKINAVYQSTFGRDADAEGLAFYSAGLADGTFSLYDISKRILDGATTGDDAAIVANKITVAQAFTAELASDPEAAAEYVGIAATTSAKALVSAVDATAASVTTATAQISVVLGVTTSTLTTGVDTIAGTAGRDKISGGVTTLSSTDTLQATDQIDGGDGNDSLTLAITKNFGGFTVGSGFLKGVETVNLSNSTTSGVTFTAKAVEGVSTYNITGPVSLAGIASLSTTVSLSDMKNLTASTIVSVGYDSTLLTGSSDSVSLSASNLGQASTTSDPFASTEVDISVTGVEALSIKGSGANFLDISGDKMTSLSLSGSGALVLESVPSTLKSYDGSGASGAQGVRFINATSMTSVKTGSGDDTAVVASTAAAGGTLRADATVDGGAGNDTLTVNLDGAVTAAWTLAGVETLRVQNTNDLTLATVSAGDLNNIFVNNDASGTNKITGLGARDMAIDLRGHATTDVDADLTVENTGSASVSISIPTGSSSAIALDDVTLTKATAVTLSLPKDTTYQTGKITGTLAKAVTVSGSGTFTQTTDGLVIPAATSLTIDQDADTTWGVAVSDGTVASSLLTDVTIYEVGTVNLTETTSTDSLANIERLTVDSEKDFTLALNLTKATSVVLSGSKDDSSMDLDNLGYNNAYGLTVTASGLKKGLNLQTLDAGTGQSISVNLTGLTSTTSVSGFEVQMDDVRVGGTTNGASPAVYSVVPTSTMTGSILVNGANSSSTVSFIMDGAIFAKDVTIDLTGSSFGTNANYAGAAGNARVVIGATADRIDDATGTAKTITADNVTIKAPTAPVKFTVGAITAKDSVTIVGPNTVSANGASGDVEITARTGSTSLTIDVTGSLDKDLFTVTGLDTQTAITVKGDLKGDASGDDKVTIDASASTVVGGQTVDVTGLVDSTTSIVGGAGKDTIKGSAGKDTIIGGASADTIDISTGGNDTILYTNLPTQTAAITSKTTTAGTSTTFLASTISNGEYVSTSSLDKILGFGVSDRIVTNTIADASPMPDYAATTALQTLGQALGKGTKLSDGTAIEATASIDVFIPGTYDATNNRFTFNASGADTLYLVEDTGDTTATALHGIVLVGYATGGVADTTTAGFTGLIGAALPA